MDDRLLRWAREKYAEGSFAAAVEPYDEVPADRLGRADDLRVKVARRRM